MQSGEYGVTMAVTKRSCPVTRERRSEVWQVGCKDAAGGNVEGYPLFRVGDVPASTLECASFNTVFVL